MYIFFKFISTPTYYFNVVSYALFTFGMKNKTEYMSQYLKRWQIMPKKFWGHFWDTTHYNRKKHEIHCQLPAKVHH